MFSQLMPKISSLHLDMIKYDVINLQRTAPDKTEFLLRKDIPANLKLELAILFSDGGKAALLEAYNMCRVYKYGPKIIQLNQINYEILEQMKINLTVADYAQPFETLIIDLPENYWKNRVVKCPQGGTINPFLQLYPEEHHPDFVVLTWNREQQYIISTVYFNSKQAYSSLWQGLNETIEDVLTEYLNSERWMYPGSMEVSDQETVVAMNAAKVALNTCLMLEDMGIKRLGSKNQAHVERLQRLIIKNKKNNREQLRHELDSIPIYYDFERKLNFKTPILNHITTDSTGRIVTPHWRSGHWRMQRCGVKLTERKRIRIDPVLVNENLLLGGTQTLTIKD